LAICHRVIERCGGRMWAEGRLGEGSIFYLPFQSRPMRWRVITALAIIAMVSMRLELG
jgi:K+-sensing histidine kinase KdpD